MGWRKGGAHPPVPTVQALLAEGSQDPRSPFPSSFHLGSWWHLTLLQLSLFLKTSSPFTLFTLKLFPVSLTSLSQTPSWVFRACLPPQQHFLGFRHPQLCSLFWGVLFSSPVDYLTHSHGFNDHLPIGASQIHTLNPDLSPVVQTPLSTTSWVCHWSLQLHTPSTALLLCATWRNLLLSFHHPPSCPRPWSSSVSATSS